MTVAIISFLHYVFLSCDFNPHIRKTTLYKVYKLSVYLSFVVSIWMQGIVKCKSRL